MTREKKEIIRRMNFLYEMQELDEILGCGFRPKGYTTETEREIDRLNRRLAKLQHYDSVDDMNSDDRAERAFFARQGLK